MKWKKTGVFLICIVFVYIASFIAGFFVAKGEAFPIQDLEIIAQDFKDGYFYLMRAGSKDTRVLQVDSDGEIVDQNIMKVSSLFNNYVIEYEGSALDIGDGYLYCIRRFIDDTTMQVMQRDVVKLDTQNLSAKPEVLHSYKRNQYGMLSVTNMIYFNNNLYIILINADGSNFYIDEIGTQQDTGNVVVNRLMDVSSPLNDKFTNASYTQDNKAVALTKSGRVYLYDRAYNADMIYPISDEAKEYAAFVAVNKLDGYIMVYDQGQKQLKYFKEDCWHEKFDENSTKFENMLNDLALKNKEYNTLYISFGEKEGDILALITDVNSSEDTCKIITTSGGNQLKVFNEITLSKKIQLYEAVQKSLQYFTVAVSLLLGLYGIVYIILHGKKIAYKFILIIIPILAVTFWVLCYKEVSNNKQVVMDLKLANAITVNHAILNHVDSHLVRELRDNRDSCWNGVYQTIYNSMQLPTGVGFDDVSDQMLSENKVAGIDQNYIYNDVFLIKDGSLYTGVSDKTGYMLPMGTQYFEGTEELFEVLKNTGVPQNGTIVSKTYRGGCYITPIIDEGEMVGVLSTTFDVYTLTKFASNSIKTFVTVAFYILVAMCVPVFLMFNIILKPIKELEKAVKRLANGDYDVRLIDTRSDEFSNIRNGFNKMCDQLSGNIYRINNISDSYFRFVPKQMFAMLEKQDVLDIKLGDKRKLNCILVTQIFHNASDIEFNIMQSENDKLLKLIDFNNKYFNCVYQVLNETDGLLMNNNFDLNKIEVTFLSSERSAVEYAINVVKKISNIDFGEDYGILDTSIIIYRDDILYSIIGEEKRLFPLVLSTQKNQIDDILLDFKFSGARIIITEEIKNALANWKELNVRYIGYSLIDNGEQQINMYEVLDGCNQIIRQQKESTLELFEKALDLFYKKDFYSARNEFSKVVKNSPLDKVAEWYLFLSHKYCDENITHYNLALYGDKDIKN